MFKGFLIWLFQLMLCICRGDTHLEIDWGGEGLKVEPQESSNLLGNVYYTTSFKRHCCILRSNLARKVNIGDAIKFFSRPDFTFCTNMLLFLKKKRFKPS